MSSSRTPTGRRARPGSRVAGLQNYAVALVAALALVPAACSSVEDAGPDAVDGDAAAAEPTPEPTPEPGAEDEGGTATEDAGTAGDTGDTDDTDGTGDTGDADEPSGWGPTLGEVARARDLVSGWETEQLVGQVVVGRYEGTDPAVPARLVRDLHLAGVSVTAENVVDEDQVRSTTAGVSDAVAADGRDFPPILGVDQEGGPVAHLRGIATDFPSFATAGRAVADDPKVGRAAVRAAARATALELRDLGFTWVWAPVADVTVGAADPTIGYRSPSEDPQVAARTVAAAVTGYRRAGLVSTTKHFPGHGSATEDSHLTLPEVDTSLAGLRRQDLPPFEAAIRRRAPAVMVGHLSLPAVAPEGVPTSLAEETYDFLRGDLGFEGVAVTDSLGMGAVVGEDFPAVTALNAGADLLLMPARTRQAVATLIAAVDDGTVPRERIEEAATRVVALQLWEQRVAAGRPVPHDVEDLAGTAAAELEAAAY